MATEEETLAKNRESVRPSYFSATDDKSTAIGEDLEAFLILADPSLREELIDRVTEDTETDEDFQELFDECLSLEKQDATAVLAAYDDKLGGFTTFREEVRSSRFGTSTDVSVLIQDTQQAQTIAIANRDRAFHRSVAVEILPKRNGGITNEQQKQRSSWESVINTYSS